MKKPMLELKLLRKSKGITRVELSKISGVPNITIQALENGKVDTDNVKLSTLVKLATALKVKVRHILPIDTANKL